MTQLAPFPKPITPHVPLSRDFLQTAKVNIQGAKWALGQGMHNMALHQIAIAVELLLKSYLLRTVTDDDWSRVHIRHDLDKAARYAVTAGLVLPPHLAEVIDLLHPHFQRGGFQHEASRTWPAGFAAKAHRAAATLACRVALATAERRWCVS
jgi:HEPN domain-containing protein